MKQVCAIILAAGLGTRMRSGLPKVMHRVLDRTMVGWVLEAGAVAGADRAVVVVGHGRALVEAHLKETAPEGVEVSFALQAEQLGTAHAVQQALPELGTQGRALILNGDLPNLPPELVSRLIALDDADPKALSFVTTRLDDPGGYGRVLRDADGAPTSIVEDRDCSAAQRAVEEINVGVYLVSSAFLHEHLAGVSASGATAEFYLTDLIARAAERGSVRAVLEPDAPPLFGVNNRSQLADAQRLAQRRTNERWMLDGVTFLLPESTLIECDVELEPDVVLGPGVHLRGRTKIGRGAVIEGHCTLTDVEVGRGATVGAGSHLRGVEVAAGWVLPPGSTRA